MNPSNPSGQEFVFERDTGIVFQHPQPSDQPFKLRKTQFTTIPKLESVNAEAYNKQFEEMRKTMPKNLAYSGRFGTPDLTPSAVVSKPAPKPIVQSPVAPPPAPLVEEPPQPAVEQPVIRQQKPSQPPKQRVTPPQPKPEPKKADPVKEEEPIQYYTGYEPEPDPFSNDAYKNKEIIIQDRKKKDSSESFTAKFKKTIKKLFAADAEDEFEEE